MNGSTASCLVAVAAASLAAACVPGQARPDAGTRRAVLELFLEPVDTQQACAVTVGLRNDSGARQGEARIRLQWRDRAGKTRADQWVRMDPVDVGQYDAKNLVVDAPCRDLLSARVRTADWRVGWDMTMTAVVPIDGVDRAEITFRWDSSIGLFVGSTAGG